MSALQCLALHAHFLLKESIHKIGDEDAKEAYEEEPWATATVWRHCSMSVIGGSSTVPGGVLFTPYKQPHSQVTKNSLPTPFSVLQLTAIRGDLQFCYSLYFHLPVVGSVSLHNIVWF